MYTPNLMKLKSKVSNAKFRIWKKSALYCVGDPISTSMSISTLLLPKFFAELFIICQCL